MPKKSKVIAKKPVITALSLDEQIFSEYVHGQIIQEIAVNHKLETQEVLDIINKKEAGDVRR